MAKKRRLEMIDYGSDEPMVDHKGRSRPLYKASSPKPATWRPSKLTRFLLGGFPGVRAMALVDVKQGALYCVLGIASAVAAVMLWVDWSRTFDNFTTFRIQPRWLLLHAAAILGAVALFELLRLLSALDEKIRGPAAPRVLAAFLVPSLAVIYATPRLVAYYPRLVEAAFCAAVVLATGALPATVWSIGMAFVRSPVAQKRLGIACLAVAVIAVACLAGAVFGLGTGAQATLRANGFELLPSLIG